jgi:hypothetical protein
MSPKSAVELKDTPMIGRTTAHASPPLRVSCLHLWKKRAEISTDDARARRYELRKISGAGNLQH